VNRSVNPCGAHRTNDLVGALIQIRRALKPDGLFVGALLGGASLTELRQCLLAAESELSGGAGLRISPFADAFDGAALLQRAGFALPVADVETLNVRYASLFDLVRDLRGMGATSLLPGVPAEMQRFFTQHVMPVMSAAGPDTVRGERQVDYHGHDESSINKALAELAKRHPNVSLRTRVQGIEGARTIRLNLVAEHEDAVQLNDLLDKAEQDLRNRLGIELRSRPTDASVLGD
jgi:hypothetical protein